MGEARTLRAVIGEQVRAARDANRWRQEDLAAQARQHGLNWRRATVAAVEAGTREVELKELFLLSAMFGQPLSWWVEGHGLDDDQAQEMIELTPDAAAPRRGLVHLLKGESPAETVADLGKGRPHGLRRRLQGLDVTEWDTQAARWSRTLQERFDEQRARAREIWPKASSEDLAAIRLAAPQDAEIKAARSLQLTPFDVATLSVQTWGHGLTAERDKRLGDLAGLDARSAQARRGHVTRALLAELRTIKEKRGL